MDANDASSEPDGVAAAGWYPDPHQPGALRYFDGEVWTEHRHNEGGGLPAVGTWLSSTFSVIGENFVPAALLSFALELVGAVLTWVVVRWAVGDLAVKDEELINFDGPELIGFLVLVAVLVIWRGFSVISRDRFMQRAHMQAGPSIADATSRAISRLPKWIAIYLLIGAVTLVALFVVLVLFALAGPALAVLVAMLLLAALLVLWVRLAFVSTAIAAAPAQQSVVASSFDVSRGRFWPVFGRLIMVIAGVALLGQVTGFVTQGISSTVDSNALTEYVTFEQTDTELMIDVADFRLAEVVPSLQSFLVFGALAALLGSLLALISTSAMMRLYLEAGGDSDTSAGETAS